MVYFFINLAIHLGISFLLLFLLLKFVRMNRERKNKHGLTFLIPVLIVLVFFLHGLWNTFPKTADSIAMVKGSYQPIVEGTVEEIGLVNNTLRIDGVVYFYNPFMHKPEVGDTIRISTTQYSNYIAVLSRVGEK